MQIEYDQFIDLHGLKVPFVPKIITPRIERQIRIGHYEAGECAAARKFVRAGDRVLELGGGVGVISSIVGKIAEVERIVSIEAHPGLLDMIRETQRVNGVTNAELRHGIAAAKDGVGVPFYLRSDFWASSMEPDSRPYSASVTLPAFGLDSLIKEIRPTVIIADIEGGELELFESSAMAGVRTVIAELHPLVYGQAGQDRIFKAFADRGFIVDQDHLKGSVWAFHRPEPRTSATPRVRLGPAAHAKGKPRVAIVTCMKDEGPFLLEWIAYHKSIGIHDFVIFTNDCRDGTDLMLDQLDELGVVTHLPNPASLSGSTYFQPVALKYAYGLPQLKRADYVMCIDVDEFISIRAGKGTFSDLLKATGPFHALSMSELNFNTSGIWEFRDCWLTETFRNHETPEPGHWQARRGVKTIIHGMANVKALQAHRPFVHDGTEDEFIWLDGSARLLSKDFVHINPQNGIDRRGAYDLVCLNHYPLRSVESFLLKHDRGDVVKESLKVDTNYFRLRSLGGKELGWIDRGIPAARKVWDGLINDSRIAALHAEAVTWHRQRITAVRDVPKIAELRDWIAANYFPERKEPPGNQT